MQRYLIMSDFVTSRISAKPYIRFDYPINCLFFFFDQWQGKLATALARHWRRPYSVRCRASRRLHRLQVGWNNITPIYAVNLITEFYLWIIPPLADRGLQRQQATHRNMEIMTTGSIRVSVVDHQPMTTAHRATIRGLSSLELKDESIQKANCCPLITVATMVSWTTLCLWQVRSILAQLWLTISELRKKLTCIFLFDKERRSPDTYHEALYSSPARPGVYSPTAHVNNRPIPMNTTYRMMENGQQDLGGPPLAKQTRSQAPTSSVYEVNYEISV